MCKKTKQDTDHIHIDMNKQGYLKSTNSKQTKKKEDHHHYLRKENLYGDQQDLYLEETKIK